MSRRKQRRRKSALAKKRSANKVREIWGFSVGICALCGKRHYHGHDYDYRHNWSEKQAIAWLKYGQADRRLDKYNSIIKKPLHPPEERARLFVEEQLDEGRI